MDHKNILSNDYFKNKLNWKQVCCSKLDKITENFEIHNSKSWSVKHLSLDKKKAFISIFHDSRTEKIAWSTFMADIFHRYGSELSMGSHQRCLHLVGSVHNKKAPVTIQVVNCKLPTLLIRHLHTFGQKRDWNETLTFLERTRIFS